MADDPKMLERLIRHQVMVQRFGGSQVKKSLPILRELARELRRRIAAGDATEFQAGRMAVLEPDIRLIISQAVEAMQADLDLDAFAQQEIEFTQDLVAASITIEMPVSVSMDTVRAITTRRQMKLVSGDKVKRLTIPEMFAEFSEAAGRDAMRIVQAGVISGQTQQQMARDVSTLVTTRSRRQAETVIRTATNAIGSAARQEMYSSLSDVMKGERFIATLDGRTTLTCASNDQKVFPIGQGPIPPLHYGCRSLRAPELRDEYQRGTQGERASMNGPVSNQLTYGGWLKRQSPEFIDDVLGPQRGQLFRSGKLKIDQFTDDSGRSLTLDELRQRYDLTMN